MEPVMHPLVVLEKTLVENLLGMLEKQPTEQQMQLNRACEAAQMSYDRQRNRDRQQRQQ